MIGIPESKLSRAQADIEPRLNAKVNCGPVNDALRTAIAPFQIPEYLQLPAQPH